MSLESPDPAPPAAPPKRWTAVVRWLVEEAAWLAFLVAVLLLGAATATSGAARASVPQPDRIGGWVGLFGLHAAILGYTAIREQGRLSQWLRPSWRGLGFGVAGGIVMIASGAGYGALLHAAGLDAPDMAEELRQLVPSETVLLLWGAVLVPVTEELYFRGRILRGLEATGGSGLAFGVSAATFALVHGIPVLIPAYLAFATILYALRSREGGALFAPIVAHAVNNLFGLL